MSRPNLIFCSATTAACCCRPAPLTRRSHIVPTSRVSPNPSATAIAEITAILIHDLPRSIRGFSVAMAMDEESGTEGKSSARTDPPRGSNGLPHLKQKLAMAELLAPQHRQSIAVSELTC